MPEHLMVSCAVCGAESQVPSPIDVPDPVEPPDFDTRPGEPLRGTMHLWLQQCGVCGYSAEDISVATPGANEIVSSEMYRNILADGSAPSLARTFLAYSLLLERMHQPADAGWSSLHAAWVCDDTNYDETAVRCRVRALELWQKGKAAGQQFSDDLVSEFALVTDVYRRTGQFEHAIVACSEGLDIEDVPPAVETMLRRQTVLIQNRDLAAHSMSELLPGRDGSES